MWKRSLHSPRAWPEARSGGVAAALLCCALVGVPYAPIAAAQDYQDGRAAYVDGDYRRAYEILEPLAEGGNSEAQKLLGIMYDYGHGVKTDPAAALAWYIKAADQGDPTVQYQVGAKYFRGDGVAQDRKEAARWWELAANGGQVDAQFNLGLMYFRGLAIEGNDEEAARLFAMAAAQGHGHAQYSLAVMHAFGRGVQQDYAAALKWFSAAADQGVAQAQYNLGVFYENGHGVEADPAAALQWYQRAAAQGLPEAQRKADQLRDAADSDGPIAHPEDIVNGAAPATAPENTRIYTPPPAAAQRESQPAPDPEPAPAAPAEVAAAAPGSGPHREDWLLRQSPDAYTLQIGSVTSEAKIRQYLATNGIESDSAYIEVVINDVTRYNALYGIYASYEEAEAAIDDLPPAVQRIKPWIRNIGVLQKLVR